MGCSAPIHPPSRAPMSLRHELIALAHLQAQELQLRQARQQLQALPQERQASVAEVETVKHKLTGAEDGLEASDRARRKLDGELQDCEQDISKYQEQEHLVRTNEQLWAIQEEIRQAQVTKSDLEERILIEMESADELGATIEGLRNKLEAVERHSQKTLEEIDRRAAHLEDKSGRLQAEIDVLKAEVPRDLRETYERVSQVREGVALAEAIDQTCMVCNFRLRPQLFLEVRNMEKVLQCDNCQRILFSRDDLELPLDLELTPPVSGS